MHTPDSTDHPLDGASVSLPQDPGIPMPVAPVPPQLAPVESIAALPPSAAAAALAPDLRTSLTGFDLLILLIFYLIGGTVLTLLVATADTLLFGAATKNTIVILTQALLFGAVMALLYGMIRSRGTADFWPSVGWRGLPRHSARAAAVLPYLLGGSLLALVVELAGSYLDRNMVVPMEQLFRDRQSVLLMAALGVLVAPLVEETIFRGCIYPILARRWGMAASILVTGVLFGTAHAAQLWPAFGQISLMMGVGIVLTYVRARTGTVAASYLVHLGYNTFIFATLFVATGGLRHLPS
jgi:uncharacterized protein